MKLKITLLVLISCLFLSGQTFREVQLPTPENLHPLFPGPLFKSTIHYGATPANYNGKVMVFNHGYIDLNQLQFFFDNDFYQNAFEAGYQAVFVATTRGKGLWRNGELLAEALDIITKKYDVSQVYITAHSNGGKASEAAMIRNNKKDKVAKVFALGTPFWGTYIADISQMPWLNWAWRLTGLNDGALTSTTYYNRDVVRPFLDNHPNNQPEKFVILGASGYWNGSNLLVRGAFTLTGGVILPVQGSNDGVSPYSSTLRPGGTYVFDENDPRAIFDHIDVGMGQFSWPYINSYLQESPNKSYSRSPLQQNPFKIESNYYILHSENAYETIMLDSNSEYALAEVFHEDPNTEFTLFDTEYDSKSAKTISSKNHQIAIPITKTKSILKSKSRYAAFIKQNNDIKMILEHTPATHPAVTVRFSSNLKSKSFVNEASVRGVIIKKATINGVLTNGSPEIIEFKKVNNTYQFDTSLLENGVYSLFVNGENETHFRRSIISGFVVGDIEKSLEDLPNEIPVSTFDQRLRLYPTVITDSAKLIVAGNAPAAPVNVTIFDVTGKVVHTFKLAPNGTSEFVISDTLYRLQKGIYIMKAENYPSITFLKN